MADFLNFVFFGLWKNPYRPVVLLAPGSALMGQNPKFYAFLLLLILFSAQVGRNARVQKYNGSARKSIFSN